ncbi:MAG: zinc-ribbon domain-containing protein [Treponema sp.]|jgi:hypothetical protein|nr:zinc-ribbon domain-containing protein [Treponema sp.]
MFCLNCGTKVDEGIKFCAHCGAKIAVDFSPGARQADNPGVTIPVKPSFQRIPPEKPGFDKNVAILGLAAVILMLIGAIFHYSWFARHVNFLRALTDPLRNGDLLLARIAMTAAYILGIAVFVKLRKIIRGAISRAIIILLAVLLAIHIYYGFVHSGVLRYLAFIMGV